MQTPSDTLHPATLYHGNLPKQRHSLGTTYSNAGDYGNIFNSSHCNKGLKRTPLAAIDGSKELLGLYLTAANSTKITGPGGQAMKFQLFGEAEAEGCYFEASLDIPPDFVTK